MATIAETIAELVRWADENGKDAVDAVQDYMLDKDSRITRAEASNLVEKARQTMKGEKVCLTTTYPVPTMAENEVVTCFEDACPVHGGAILEEHSFGMLGEMTIFTFEACGCACSSDGWPNGMRYHSSYALAAGAAQMQVEMNAVT
jgi:hypothetical protein